MTYIERAITPILKNRVSTTKCLLVTGARQVGKSTLIKHAFPEYNRANFDDRLTRMQAKEEPKLFFLNNPTPLFIDEVQKENSVLEEIKQIVDESDQRGQFILSGSQKLELMKGMSESLAGRVSITELTGLSQREINRVSFNRHFVPSVPYIKERSNPMVKYSPFAFGTAFTKASILNCMMLTGIGRIFIHPTWQHIWKEISTN